MGWGWVELGLVSGVGKMGDQGLNLYVRAMTP